MVIEKVKGIRSSFSCFVLYFQFLPLLSMVSMIFLITSCAGYKFRESKNPLAQYNIYSLSIPMFFNRSTIPNVAGPITKEFTLLMSNFYQLKVYPGVGNKADAVLLGIIDSPDHLRSTLVNSDMAAIDPAPGASPTYQGTGGRKRFYVPKTTVINLSLRIILIKNPTHQEVELFLSPMGNLIYKHPKVIFNETIGLSGSFGRDVSDNLGADSGGVVNFTKNKGSQEKQIQEMAKSAALNFREMILYAF